MMDYNEVFGTHRSRKDLYIVTWKDVDNVM